MLHDPHYRTIVIQYDNPDEVPDIPILGELMGGHCMSAAVGDMMTALEKAEALLNEIDPYLVQEAQERLDAQNE